MKALGSFTMSGTADSTAYHNIKEDLKLQQHHCENIKSHVCKDVIFVSHVSADYEIHSSLLLVRGYEIDIKVLQ